MRSRPRSASRRTLFPRWALLCWLLSAACGLLAWGQNDEPAVEKVPPHNEATKKFQKAAIIPFDGEIGPLLQGYLERKLKEAERLQVDLLVLVIDSPGGRVHESREIAERLHRLSNMHTVAFVPREALSGAAYVSLGCDEIIMNPQARLGDVGVIFLDDDFMFRYAPEKIRSALVQELRILAEAHDRPPALAEAMVDMDVEVFRYENNTTNEIAFLSEKEFAVRQDQDAWTKHELVIESQKGRFLTVSGKRATEIRLAEGNADGLPELKARFNVAGEWLELTPDTTDRAVHVLHLWWVTGLLFLGGLIGILMEFLHPGTCLGGLFAFLCFSLFFWSRFLSGTSGWLEVTLFVVGLICLGIEFFVLPGFGISGVAGMVLILTALVLACQNFVIPHNSQQLATTGWALATVVVSTGAFFVAATIILNYAGNLPFLNRLMLRPPVAEVAGKEAKHQAHDESVAKSMLQIGTVGRAETMLRPSGRGRFGDEFVEVVSSGELISGGASIKIVELDGYRIVVEQV